MELVTERERDLRRAELQVFRSQLTQVTSVGKASFVECDDIREVIRELLDMGIGGISCFRESVLR